MCVLMGWKKIIAILCAAAAMVSVIPAGYSEGNEGVYTAAAATTPEPTPEPTPHVNPYIETDQFRFNAATGTIVQYIGSETEVEIPAEIAGVAVTEIGENAFMDNNSLKSIILPEGVTSIGDRAFLRCDEVESLILPKSLVSIGVNAFGTLNIKEIIIPENVEYIGEAAFVYCTSLTSLIIPEKVKEITRYMFFGCYNLESITFPKDVEIIDPTAFMYCNALANINISEENTSYTVQDGVLFNKDMSKLVRFLPADKREIYSIPEGVRDIGAYAFSGNDYIKSIATAESVTSLDEYSFEGCTALEDVFISSGVLDINISSFVNSRAIKSVVVESSNPSFCNNNGAVYNKEKTELLYYPAGSDNKEYTVSYGTVKIGGYAFYGCESLENVVFPNGLKQIGQRAFFDCIALNSVFIPDGTEIIESMVFKNCKKLRKVSLPDSIKELNIGAFNSCRGLSEVNIPKSITVIEENVFVETNIKNIDIPDNIKIIKDDAFCGSKLESVTIPASVEKIGEGVFDYCSNLVLRVIEKSPAYTYAVEKNIPYIIVRPPVWKLSAAVSAGMLGTSVTNMSDETVTGTIITVYYDEGDKIIDVKVNPLTLKPNDNLIADEPISIGKYVRIFAWDTALGMTPLSSDVTVNLS